MWSVNWKRWSSWYICIKNMQGNVAFTENASWNSDLAFENGGKWFRTIGLNLLMMSNELVFVFNRMGVCSFPPKICAMCAANTQWIGEGGGVGTSSQMGKKRASPVGYCGGIHLLILQQQIMLPLLPHEKPKSLENWGFLCTKWMMCCTSDEMDQTKKSKFLLSKW